MSGYFDPTYFDPAYFDTGTPPSVGGGHAKWRTPPQGGTWKQPRGEMPPLPAWLAIAARKRKREEEELLCRLLEARRRFVAAEDDEWLLGMRDLPSCRLLD